MFLLSEISNKIPSSQHKFFPVFAKQETSELHAFFMSNTFINALAYFETRISENIENWTTRIVRKDCTWSK